MAAEPIWGLDPVGAGSRRWGPIGVATWDASPAVQASTVGEEVKVIVPERSIWEFAHTHCPHVRSHSRYHEALAQYMRHTGGGISSVRVRDPPPRPPPPPPCPPGPLSYQWSIAAAIHMVAPRAPEFFFPCPSSTPPRPGGGAPQHYP